MPTPSTSPPRSTPAHLKKYYKCKSKKSIKNKEKLITKLEDQIESIKYKNENKTQKLRKKINKDREKMEDNCKKIKKQEETQIKKIYERIEKLVDKVEDEKDKCYKFHPNGKKN